MTVIVHYLTTKITQVISTIDYSVNFPKNKSHDNELYKGERKRASLYFAKLILKMETPNFVLFAIANC